MTEKQEQEQQAEVVQDKKEESSSDEETIQDKKGAEGEVKDGKKSNRGEKKFKKAMVKLGMKAVVGITRVTIRKGKSVFLYIDNPEVMKSPGVDNSYVIFGEANMNDMSGNLGADEAKKFKQQEKPEVPQQQKEEVQQEKVQTTVDDSNEELSEEGLTADALKMVMEHCKCEKRQAIKALRETNGDAVEAILKLAS